MKTPHFARAPAATLTPRDETRAAASKRRIPFVHGAPLAGWGPFSLFEDRVAHEEDAALPLHVRALVLEHGGERVALCSVDLHGGSRWVSERVAVLCAADGFDIGNVFICGTHNHAGPAGLYASHYYDAFGGSTSVLKMLWPPARIAFNHTLAEHLAQLLADAIHEAVTNLTPARLAFAVSRLPEWNVNRSFPAFLANFQELEDDDIKRALIAHGLVEPHDARPLNERHAVDNRVRSVCVFGDGERVIGAYSTYGAHNAIQHRRHLRQSSDYFGFAALETERRFPGAVCVLATGSIGDSDPLPPGETRKAFIAKRETLSASDASAQLILPHGRALAEVLSANVAQARAHARPLERLASSFCEEVVADASTKRGVLASDARVGVPTFGGSELGRGPGAIEGRRAYLNESQPHSSKLLRSLNPVNLVSLLTTRHALASQHDRLPVRLLELRLAGAAPVRLLSLPGEPTTMLSLGLMALLRDDGAHPMVSGVTGDYAGYLTTFDEYCAQHYEGSSTIWGRLTGDWLHERATELLHVLAGRRDAHDLDSHARFDAPLETWATHISGHSGHFRAK